MSSSDSNQKDGGRNTSNAWEEAQRAVRDRNEQTRREGRQEREADERRAAAAQHERDRRYGVER
jgi:hypothetical protein